MIVADTNVWIAYLKGEEGADVSVLDSAMISGEYVMAPVVLCELLSDPQLGEDHETRIMEARRLPLQQGYWVRAGKLRAALIAKELRPRLAETLIAQFCIDYHATLLTRDAGFRRFATVGLRLHSRTPRQ